MAKMTIEEASEYEFKEKEWNFSMADFSILACTEEEAKEKFKEMIDNEFLVELECLDEDYQDYLDTID